MKKRPAPQGAGRLPPAEMVHPQDADVDFVTQDLFHQPTLESNDVAERLVITPFPEGADYAG